MGSGPGATTKLEVLTKVAAFLFNHGFGATFPAFVGERAVVVRAIATDPEVGPTSPASLAPSGLTGCGEFLPALEANAFHAAGSLSVPFIAGLEKMSEEGIPGKEFQQGTRPERERARKKAIRMEMRKEGCEKRRGWPFGQPPGDKVVDALTCTLRSAMGPT